MKILINKGPTRLETFVVRLAKISDFLVAELARLLTRKNSLF